MGIVLGRKTTNWLTREHREGLPPVMQQWLAAFDRYSGQTAAHWLHLEDKLGIAKHGRVIPKDVQGIFAVPGTGFEVKVYASGARGGHGRRGNFKRVFAICPLCHKEVEAGHTRQHAYAHRAKGAGKRGAGPTVPPHIKRVQHALWVHFGKDATAYHYGERVYIITMHNPDIDITSKPGADHYIVKHRKGYFPPVAVLRTPAAVVKQVKEWMAKLAPSAGGTPGKRRAQPRDPGASKLAATLKGLLRK